MQLVLRHAQINAAQAEQSVACLTMHNLPQRLARWLLISNDRVDSKTMRLTQDYMGIMTGAVRSSVSLAANAFKRDGLIDYRRGRLEILDRGSNCAPVNATPSIRPTATFCSRRPEPGRRRHPRAPLSNPGFLPP
jgi:hypothetical protein